MNPVRSISRRLTVHLWSLPLFVGLMITVAPLIASAVGTEESDSRPIKLALSGVPEEVDSVDNRDGNLTIRHTDLLIPGNGGLDIAVTRMYALNQLSAGLTASYVMSYKWLALGPGWNLMVAPRITEDNNYVTGGNNSLYYSASSLGNLCNGVPLTSGSMVINGVNTPIIIDGRSLPTLELPTGERLTLYSSGGGVAYTSNNWRVSCSGGFITAKSPAGVTYDFGALSANRMIGTYSLSRFPPPPGGGGIPPDRSVSYIDALSATDANGNWLKYQYTTFGSPYTPWAMPGTYSSGSHPPGRNVTFERGRVPSSITSSDGRSVSFAYSPTTGRLTSVTDNAGRTLQYQYTSMVATFAADFLTRVIRPDGTDWRYAYNNGGYRQGAYHQVYSGLSDSTVQEYRLQALTYPTGGSISYVYDYYNLSASINLGNGGSALFTRGERVKRRTLSTGETWQYAYTRGGAGQFDVTTVTGPEGVTTYRYMSPGYVRNNDATVPWVWENNAWKVGQLIDQTMPDGSTESYEYTPRVMSSAARMLQDLGNVRDQQNWTADLSRRTVIRNGTTHVTTNSTFDAYGNPTTIVESGPNGGNRTVTRTYLNDTAKWIIGRLKDESSVGKSELRTFDANGNMVTFSRTGVTTSFTYTSEGDVASVTRPGPYTTTLGSYMRGIPQTESQPDSVNIARAVSAAGFVTSETNGEGHTRSFTFDGLGRETSITYAQGSPSTITYTANSRTATRGGLSEVTVYDGFGRATSVTLGGITTTYAHDFKGRKTFESNPGSSSGTSFEYDVFNRLKKVTYADGSFKRHDYGIGAFSITDERSNVTTYFYRSYGNPDERFLMGIATPVASANVAIDRGSNDLVSSVQQGVVLRTFGYDSRNFLVTETHPELGTITYGRDGAGNMTSRRIGSGPATTYSYDGHNRGTGVWYPDGTSTTQTYTRNNKQKTLISAAGTRGFTYDANDNLTIESLVSDGVTLTTVNAYNSIDQLSSTTYPISGRVVSYFPDVLGRPSQASGFVSAVSYWPSGQVGQINYANGTVSSYGQNTRLWTSSFSTSRSGTAITAQSYSYDYAGNLTTISDTVDPASNRSMGFDAINRLTSASGPWGNGSISYDGAGNIGSQTFGTYSLAYSYDGANRLNAIAGSRNAAYSYDAAGNVLSNGSQSFSYDYAPNLRCSNCSGASRVDYAYDALNQRVWSNRAGVKTYEFFDARGSLVVEYTPATGKLVEYIYIGGKRIAQQSSTQGAMFLHNDAAGSPHAATDAAGNLLWREHYRPYGTRIDNSGAAAANTMWFTGKQQDPATELLYMGARYYDPVVGRFTGMDPAPFNEQNIHSFNRYAYANNNPYKFVDPDGHTPLDLVFLAYDLGKLGVAIYTGVGVTAAAVDVGLSMVGVGSPMPGVGQALKAMRIIDKAVDTGRAFERAGEFGLKGYNELQKLTKGTGLDAHHLIEKRFAATLGLKEGEMTAIALTKAEHQALTNAWRQAIPYGKGTDNATKAEIESVAREIYKSYPEILKALGLK